MLVREVQTEDLEKINNSVATIRPYSLMLLLQ